MAVQGTRESQAPIGDKSASRHRAEAWPSEQGRPAARTKPAALATVPTIAAALLGVLAAAVLIHHSRAMRPIHGNTLTALWVLGVLLVCVIFASVVWGRSVARSGYLPVPRAAPAPAAPAGPPAAAPVDLVAEDGTVFVHLSQRLQSLVHRQIELLDALENDVEEPDLLKGLFSVDHLATRMRRHAENLAVLGGAVPRRQWTRPISVMEVLRSAVSETLDYARVQVIARAPGFVNGHAVADVVHLLAELVENATAFSPPETKVVLRTYPVALGLAVEIDDRGLGMDRPEYDRLNILLREPVGVSVQELLEGGRIGLYVVAQLARRHGIAVQLQTNITGGTQALVVLPKVLLTDVKQLEPPPRRDQSAPQSPPAPQRQAAPHVESAVASPDLRSAAPQTAGVGPVTSDMPRRKSPRYGVDATLPAPRRPAPEESAPAGAGDGDAGRPPLPRRRPQEHLSTSLLDGGLDPADRVGEDLSPTLMADFRGGLARGAAVAFPAAAPTDHMFDQEGER